MAVPSYTEDLTDIDLAESGSTGYTALNISGGGGGAPAFGTDLGMQGSGCWDKPCSGAERAIAVNKTPGAATVAASVHIFQWGFCATPGITDTLALRGAYVLAGTSETDIVQFHVEGNETFGAIGRVGKCYTYRYVTTSNTGSIPYRTVLGSPGATPTYFGYGLSTTASAKGSNIGMDAVRYGTGAYITAGEIANPATFDGFSSENDALANRWGILTNIGGSYELQGRFVIGQSSAGTPTLAYFNDADVSISILDTVHSETDFTQIIIDHASTEVYWNNISITALGANNRGRIVVNNAATVAQITGGTYTAIGISTLRAACVFTGTTWRTCDAVTNNSASLVACLFDRSTATTATNISSLDDLDACEFISNGTGYGVTLPTITTTQAMGWNCTEPGATYAAANGTTGNETIRVVVNGGQVLTINVGTGGSTPTIHVTGGGSVSVVSSKTLTLTGIPTGVQVTIVNSSTRTELQNSVSTGADITYGHSGGETVDILLIATAYDPNASSIYNLPLPSSDSSIPFSLSDDRNYENL
jgi:hypothetical protein